jgi:hypothetical protein
MGAPCAGTQDLNSLSGLAEPIRQLRAKYGVMPERVDCIQNPMDPFDPGAVMKDGKSKGECSDGSTNRPPVVVGEDDEYIEVANFKHAGKWWKAKIPKNGIDSVLFQIIDFTSIPIIEMAHTQYRIVMKPDSPILLHSQDLSKPEESSIVGDFIITSNVAGPHGEGFNALKGFAPNFNLITRLQSWDDRAAEEIAGDHSTVMQQDLLLKPEEKKALLLNGIHGAQKDWYNVSYHTLHRNCTTAAFDLLDTVHPRPNGVEPFDVPWYHALHAVIQPSLDELAKRGLINLSLVSSGDTEMNFYVPRKDANGKPVLDDQGKPVLDMVYAPLQQKILEDAQKADQAYDQARAAGAIK